MITLSGCKVNLGLTILGKRADGFHNIETMMFPIPWHDIIEIVPSSSFTFSTSGIQVSADPSDNLVVKAYHLIRSHYQIPPVQIHLHKQVPFGAGLGGGSANAAATLLLINKLFQLGLNTERLKDFAASLGSDCPFFIENQPAMAYDRGTDLEGFALDLKGFYILLIKPDFSISTAKAYSLIKSYSQPDSIKKAVSMPIDSWKNYLVNDFEIALQNEYPQIESLKQDLYRAGAVYASMSGSGSALFGIFSKLPQPINQPNLLQKVICL